MEAEKQVDVNDGVERRNMDGVWHLVEFQREERMDKRYYGYTRADKESVLAPYFPLDTMLQLHTDTLEEAIADIGAGRDWQIMVYDAGRQIWGWLDKDDVVVDNEWRAATVKATGAFMPCRITLADGQVLDVWECGNEAWVTWDAIADITADV